VNWIQRPYIGKGSFHSSTFKEGIHVAIEKKEAAISLLQLEGVFLFWYFGIAGATLMFICERFLPGLKMRLWKFQRRRNSSTKPYRYLK